MWDVARSPISDYKRLYYTVLYTQFGIKSINQDNIAEMKKKNMLLKPLDRLIC